MSTRQEGILVAGVLLACQAVTWMEHPRIGILDADAYAYILGAYSLQDSGRYAWLDGEPIAHWPPGYSALLSLFPMPIQAAQAINYLAISAAAAFCYGVLRKCAWNVTEALGLTVVLHVGFFQQLAVNVKPDILTYALFLGITCLVEWRRPACFLLSCCCYNALVPLKLIAVTFAPAAAMEWAIRLRKGVTWTSLACVLLALLSLGALLAWILWFNSSRVGNAIPTSHAEADWVSMAGEVGLLPFAIGRTLLTSWYGTVREPVGAIATVVQFGTALCCLIGIHVNSAGWGRFGRFGVAILIAALLLRLVRHFEWSVRLCGYGLLLVLAGGLVPKPGRSVRWCAYAAVSCIVTIVNAWQVNQLGGNDPRYREFAAEAALLVRAHLPETAVIYSNGFHILDVHERIATVPVTADEVKSVPDGSFVLYTNLPCYDGIATPIANFDFHPPSQSKTGAANGQWERVFQIRDGTLYRRVNRK